VASLIEPHLVSGGERRHGKTHRRAVSSPNRFSPLRYCTIINEGSLPVAHLSKSLATEWAVHGIRVNSISPGYTATGLVNEALDRRPEWKELWVRDTPMGRLAEPREIAGPVVFLASAAASFVTGHDLVIDGGFTSW